VKEKEKVQQKKSSVGSGGGKQKQGNRKTSRSRSSSGRSTSSGSSSSGSSRSRSTGSRRRRRRSRSSGRRDRGRRNDESGRRGYAADRGRGNDRFHWYAKSEKKATDPAASKTDRKTAESTASADAADVKVKSSVPSLMPINTGPVTQPEPPQSTVTKAPNQPAAGLGKVATPETKVCPSVPPPQTTMTQPQEASTPGSAFSRENIVRNLEEMVTNAAPDIVPKPAGDSELFEKEKSAFELAISLYMAAQEFCDGGSLWCRQCDTISADISSLCRHIHSDKHHLVSCVLIILRVMFSCN